MNKELLQRGLHRLVIVVSIIVALGAAAYAGMIPFDEITTDKICLEIQKAENGDEARLSKSAPILDDHGAGRIQMMRF